LDLLIQWECQLSSKLVVDMFNNKNVSFNWFQLVGTEMQPDLVDNWFQPVAQLQRTTCNRSFVVLVRSYEILKKKRPVLVAVAQKIAKKPDRTGL
jgi:hypothetical protein